MMQTPNISGTLIPNELNGEKGTINLAHNQYNFSTFVNTQQVLLRASSETKVEFLGALFEEIKNDKYASMIVSLLAKYFKGKANKYLHTLDRSEYIHDMDLKDNNRSMNPSEMKAYLHETALWFKFVDNIDLQVGIFLSFLSMCGNSVVTKILNRIHVDRKFLLSQAILKSSAECESTEFSDEATSEDYVEDLDDSDPDVQLLYKRREEWKDAMAKYRSKVELSINGPGHDNPKKSATKQRKPSSEKKGKKDKKGDASKKEKKSTKEKKSKKSGMVKAKGGKKKFMPEIDFLQLMPIWISMKIFKYLDEKTLKIIKDVNIYWNFVVTSMAQEEKERKKVNSWIESIEEEFNLKDCALVYPVLVKPQFRFRRHEKHVLASDLKVYEAIEKEIDGAMLPAIPVRTSLLSEIANDKDVTFNLPAHDLQPFERIVHEEESWTAHKYIHQRPKCIQFDNITLKAIPIRDIELSAEFVEDFHDDRKSSFCFWPEMIKEYQERSGLLNSRKTSTYLTLWNPLNKASEMEHVINIMVEKSMLHFQNVMSKRAKRMSSIGRHSALSSADVKRSIQLGIINTSLQVELLNNTGHELQPSVDTEQAEDEAEDDIQINEIHE